jgi:hypothetical protein
MTHCFSQRRESNRFPVRIILIKGRDCFCYKLSSRIQVDWLPKFHPRVLMDKEEKNIVLGTIDDNRHRPLCA